MGAKSTQVFEWINATRAPHQIGNAKATQQELGYLEPRVAHNGLSHKLLAVALHLLVKLHGSLLLNSRDAVLGWKHLCGTCRSMARFMMAECEQQVIKYQHDTVKQLNI